MNKQLRQYAGLVCAVTVYFIIHEGAHLLYALSAGVFKQINFIGLGIQIDVYADRMTSGQMGLFCLWGSVATAVTAYALSASAGWIRNCTSKLFKACMYYTTIAMLLIDPLYLSILCGFLGGGDMNGISLLVPQSAARLVYGGIFVINAGIFFRTVLPTYKAAFAQNVPPGKGGRP